MASESFLATFGLVGLRLVELHGIDPQRFIEQAGIESSLVMDTRTRLPTRLADIGFEKAMSLIADPAFALRAAECWHPSNLGVLGHAWLSSDTLRTGLKRLARFSHILGTRGRCTCVDDRNGLRFVFDHGRGNAAIGHAIADFCLSMILDMCRTNFGASLQVESVSLRRPEPENPEPYRGFFGCSVRFSADENSFVLARIAADRPLPTSNSELAITFDAILAEQLAVLDKADIVARCKAYLLRQLTSGEPSEEELAGAMGMSCRTLQRRLGGQGLRYKGVLDEMRYDLAQRYLSDPEKSVTEITFLLGFSEQSAFSRAFKRWSGQAPTLYRTEKAELA